MRGISLSGFADKWIGPTWERYCRQLLNLRYNESYQPVPDRDRGDFGIDGFTSQGALFQCYAAEDPESIDDLYRKQRDKITTDLGKLEKNIDKIGELTAPSDIKCWVLLVPRHHTKRLLSHAAKKATELLAKGLAGMAPDFFVRVLTDEDFEPEKGQLASAGAAMLPAPPADPDEATIREWRQSEPAAEATLKGKISRLPNRLPADKQQQLCVELIRRHLFGAATGDQLRRLQPEIWERINGEKKQRETVLSVESLTATSNEGRTLRGEVDEIRSRLRAVLSNTDIGLEEGLAWGFVADWLIRCPLDYPPQSTATHG